MTLPLQSMPEVACDCPRCQSMCAQSVCLPTPDEARELVRLHPERMARYEFAPTAERFAYVAPAIAGRAGEVLAATNLGRCSFFDGARCELHGTHKPFEGRIARHDRDWKVVRRAAGDTWGPGDYQAISKQLVVAQG